MDIKRAILASLGQGSLLASSLAVADDALANVDGSIFRNAVEPFPVALSTHTKVLLTSHVRAVRHDARLAKKSGGRASNSGRVLSRGLLMGLHERVLDGSDPAWVCNSSGENESGLGGAILIGNLLDAVGQGFFGHLLLLLSLSSELFKHGLGGGRGVIRGCRRNVVLSDAVHVGVVRSVDLCDESSIGFFRGVLSSRLLLLAPMRRQRRNVLLLLLLLLRTVVALLASALDDQRAGLVAPEGAGLMPLLSMFFLARKVKKRESNENKKINHKCEADDAK
jgi:hypothetical protein